MRITTKQLASLAAVGLLGMGLAGCGDSDSKSSSGGGGGGDNSVTVTMKDYSYSTKGELTAGMAAITAKNAGDEFHMLILAKMKDGTSIADFVKDMKAASEAGGEEESLGVSEPELELIAQTSTTGAETTTTTAGGAPAGGGEEEEGEDPFAKYFEEDDETGSPYNQVVQPGQEATITTNTLTAGTYAMLCFVPTEEDGAPHVEKGMAAELVVKDGTSTMKAPTADATYELSADAPPSGPKELKAGERTIKVTADESLQFAGGMPDDGEDFDSFDEYFTEMFEGENPPPKGSADDLPGHLAFFTESVSDEPVYITVDLDAGSYFFASIFDDEDTGESTDQTLDVTVK